MDEARNKALEALVALLTGELPGVQIEAAREILKYDVASR